MFVEAILPALQKRLVTIKGDATAKDAAELMLHRRTDLLVVCDHSQKLIGVLTKTDLIRAMGTCVGAACVRPLSTLITCDVVTCAHGDDVRGAWNLMKARNLRNIPVVDDQAHVIGVLNARDALDLLLKEAEYDEVLLRDYVMCAGYH